VACCQASCCGADYVKRLLLPPLGLRLVLCCTPTLLSNRQGRAPAMSPYQPDDSWYVRSPSVQHMLC
jgi:hypothetical protein